MLEIKNSYPEDAGQLMLKSLRIICAGINSILGYLHFTDIIIAVIMLRQACFAETVSCRQAHHDMSAAVI